VVNKGRYHDSWYTLLAKIFGAERAEIERQDARRQARRRAIFASISLAVIAILSVALVVAIISRELAVSALRSFAAAEHVVIGASLAGKVKTFVQVIAISLLIIYNQLGEFSHLTPLSLWASLMVTVYSGVEYFVRFARLIIAGEPETKKRESPEGPPASSTVA